MADRDYLDPTNHDFIDGFESGSRNGKNVGKLSGMYVLPWDIAVAAKFEGHTSYPFNPNILSRTMRFSRHDRLFFSGPTNEQRLPTLCQLDLHVDKAFQLRWGAPLLAQFRPVQRQEQRHRAGEVEQQKLSRQPTT
jgi:hypothetical protein